MARTLQPVSVCGRGGAYWHMPNSMGFDSRKRFGRLPALTGAQLSPEQGRERVLLKHLQVSPKTKRETSSLWKPWDIRAAAALLVLPDASESALVMTAS